jgi:hypothetical protein
MALWQVYQAFSSRVASLGGSENATNHNKHFQAEWLHSAARKMRPITTSIFKPSGFTWRLGKCDQSQQAFSSRVASLGGSENATNHNKHFQAEWLHSAARCSLECFS